MLQYFKKTFAHKKLKKPPSKVAQKYFIFFLHYCPELPKQKNSCSKIWLIDQLYIKLGQVLFGVKKIFMLFFFQQKSLAQNTVQVVKQNWFIGSLMWLDEWSTLFPELSEDKITQLLTGGIFETGAYGVSSKSQNLRAGGCCHSFGTPKQLPSVSTQYTKPSTVESRFKKDFGSDQNLS